ncbi:MAG: PQQ-binding-like beta-propeller repeat protein, partial [Verrucomicrobiales bacterium]|nr:PQQ-binding-like beta-propeller repeat protein [Verrucomicrobiales bacterium]
MNPTFSSITLIALVSLVTPLPLHAQQLAPGLTFHQKPKPLPAGATTEDWPRFLGPDDDATSGETKLLHTWPETGPALLWELAKGDDYTSPSILGDHLVHFTRSGGHEVITCLHPETGQLHWTQKYPVDYRDRYGFNPGPRASPVIDAGTGRVYTFGVTAQLQCFDLKTGNRIWKKDLLADYDIPTYFFGSGPCPVIHGDLIIQNVGGRHPTDATQNPCVVAFDKNTGEQRWVHRDT